MARTVTLGERALEVTLTGFTEVEAVSRHFTIPYDVIRKARAGPYRPPVGTLRIAGTSVPWTDVREGHFERGGHWLFLSYEDPVRAVVLELGDLRLDMRHYDTAVVGVDDPEGFLRHLSDRMRDLGLRDPVVRPTESDIAAGASDDEGPISEDDPVAWTALRGGETVISADGAEVGRVTHPLGDPGLDVFEGVGFRKGLFGRCRMARPEEIDTITLRKVVLKVPAGDVEALPDYAEADVRTARAGRGFFRHKASWKGDDDWHEPG